MKRIPILSFMRIQPVQVCETDRLHAEQIMKDPNSPIYAFFSPVSDIEYVNSQHSHVFRCLAKSCNQKVWCYLDKSNRVLMGNMHKHIHLCVTQVDRLTSRSRILTLREVLMKRHCILKVRLRWGTRDKETRSQPDELQIRKTHAVIV